MTILGKLCAAAWFMLLPMSVAFGQSGAPSYIQTNAVTVGSPERWDYLSYDGETHRLYLSHGDRVDVLDGRTGAILGTVQGIPGGTHGVAVANEQGKGYTDDGKAGEIIAFDLKSFKVLAHIKAKEDADGIIADPKTGNIFIVDGDSAEVTVVDPKTDAVVASVPAGGGLEFATADGRGKVFVNGAQHREIVRIDTGTYAVDAHWPIPNCASPHGMAIDAQSHRLFVSCVNKLMTIVNADTGAVVATLPIGAGTDAAAFDPSRKLVFSSNGVDGTISVIREKSPQEFVLLGEIKTMVTARTMAIDPASGRLYLAAAAIDPAAPIAPGLNGRPGRPKPLPGSLKVLFLDPK